jgi:hypothetical protein
MAKRSLKDVLIYAGQHQKAGKGELRPIKIGDDGELMSDEAKADAEQAAMYENRKKRALKLMGGK